MTLANKNTIRPVITWCIFTMFGIFTYQTYTMQFALILWASHFKAVMDTLQFHFDSSIFSDKKNKQWYDPRISCNNKYSDVKTLTRKKFLKFIPVPVMFTDHWHLAQSFMLATIFASIAYVLYFEPYFGWWQDVLIMRCLFGFDFILYYNFLFKK